MFRFRLVFFRQMMGPRAVACFTFDNMGEAADVGAGLPRDLHRDDRSLSIGFRNLFALLDRHGVTATFFIEGWNGEHHADVIREIVQRGHELGMHGWLHEPWAQLERYREMELAARATTALERAAGVRPLGFRAPGGARGPHTEGILTELGYTYDASLDDHIRPRLLPSGLVQIPFVWAGVDGAYYLRPDPADAIVVRDVWLRNLERAAKRGGLFLLICHAFITGVDERRLAALDAVMKAAVTDHRVVVRTTGAMACRLRATKRQWR